MHITSEKNTNNASRSYTGESPISMQNVHEENNCVIKMNTRVTWNSSDQSSNFDVDFPESTFKNTETSTLMFNNPYVNLIATNSEADKVA